MDMMLVGRTVVVWVFCDTPVFMNVAIDESLSALVLVMVFVIAALSGRLDEGNSNWARSAWIVSGSLGGS